MNRSDAELIDLIERVKRAVACAKELREEHVAVSRRREDILREFKEFSRALAPLAGRGGTEKGEVVIGIH